MKKRMLEIMEKFHKYNTENMAYLAFGLDTSIHYDALVVAPSFSPYKLKMDRYCKVTTLREGAYIAGYCIFRPQAVGVPFLNGRFSLKTAAHF